jgi:hypothetical protein
MKIRYLFIGLEAHFDSSRTATYAIVLKVKFEIPEKKKCVRAKSVNYLYHDNSREAEEQSRHVTEFLFPFHLPNHDGSNSYRTSLPCIHTRKRCRTSRSSRRYKHQSTNRISNNPCTFPLTFGADLSLEPTVQVINPLFFLSRTKSQEESLHYSVF